MGVCYSAIKNKLVLQAKAEVLISFLNEYTMKTGIVPDSIFISCLFKKMHYSLERIRVLFSFNSRYNFKFVPSRKQNKLPKRLLIRPVICWVGFSGVSYLLGCRLCIAKIKLPPTPLNASHQLSSTGVRDLNRNS